jgi:heterotetrameric sarcosine oxidase gamma subunit
MADAITVRWTPRGAWDGIAKAGRFGPSGAAGVMIKICEGFALASVLTSAADRVELSRVVAHRWGGELPVTGRAALAGERAILWSGPDSWLLVADSQRGFAEDVQALAAVAAVSDQSEARAVVRISGPRARDALAKGCMIDLHPSAFVKDAVASTMIAYIGVQIWRRGDAEDAFDIFVPRSMAGSFWSWLSSSAAEFGCEVTYPA